MRIQHNIMAMSAYRNYTNNVSAMKKNLEKLSSGYKINRAGDDAAGLAISEKMRAQITGLETAQKNAKDGISLVQTAEGALTEVHDMLNRMVELATQSANGTYSDTTDREQLQKEVDQLKSEINRIADSSNFNGIKLLDGSMDGTVTNDTTEYTKGKNNIPILQEVALDPTTEVGEKTVLHVDGSTMTGKTSFKVELHNINMSGVNGDGVSVTIGDKTLNLKFDKNATDYNTAGKLKEGALSTDNLGAAIVNAWNAGTKMLGGQVFNVTYSQGALKFEQASNPTNSSEIVEPFKEVTVEFHSSNSQAKSSTVLNAAQKNALAKSQKIVLNGKEYDFALANSAAKATKTFDGFEITYDNGKLEVTNTAGTAGPTSLAIGGTVAGTDITSAAASQTNGSAATASSSGDLTLSTGVSAWGAVSSSKITFYAGDGTSVSFTIDGASASGTATVAIGGTTYTLGWSGTGGISLTAATVGTAGDQNFMVKIEQIAGTATVFDIKGAEGISTSGGKNQVGGKATFDLGTVTQGETIEFNGKKFTVESSVADTAKEIAAYAQSAFGDMFEMVAASGTELEFTSKITITAANVSNMVVLKKGGAEETDITDLLEDKTMASEADGTWNVKTTENKVGSVSGPGVLASTTFKLNSGIVKDGNVLTIGNKNFTFKVGKDSTTTGENVIDLTKYEEGDDDLIDAAAKILGQQTSDVFTIGYDESKKGVISIHEKANQTIYTNGELSDVGTFDALVYFNSKEDATSTETTTAGGKSLMLQIGDTADEFNQLRVNIKDMHAAAMGVADLSVADQESAAKAVDAIKAAINYVSDMRGTLGATQNRLDHTINNLSVMTENIQDAESTIRDTDVADEMMAYTKNNILIQSAQAMLAQANQVPQGVLQLLQ